MILVCQYAKIPQIPEEILPHAEEAMNCIGRELTIHIRRIGQMIRERTRRLNKEESDRLAAEKQLQAELGDAVGGVGGEVWVGSMDGS